MPFDEHTSVKPRVYTAATAAEPRESKREPFAFGESETHRTAGGRAAGSAPSNSFTIPETHRTAGGRAARNVQTRG